MVYYSCEFFCITDPAYGYACSDVFPEETRGSTGNRGFPGNDGIPGKVIGSTDACYAEIERPGEMTDDHYMS